MNNKLPFLRSNFRPTSIFCGLLFVLTLDLLSVSVRSQCSTGWDASGELAMFQRGQAQPIMLKLEQKGRAISGRAVQKVGNNFGEITNGGLVDGSIDGDSIAFQIFWPPDGRLTGVYKARILPTGRLDGETYDKNNPRIRQTWFSGGALKCPPPPAPPAPKVLKSTGKAKTSSVQAKGGASPPASPPPPMKVPGIVASQVYYQFPNAPTGFVVLTWDAGPDHTYAEVWFKVNNGEETFLVEQGKGSRQIPVERYKYYTYILTDAGKTLSTVNFAAQ